MTQASVTNRGKTKILFAAPLVIIPFCALLFHVLGGGTPKDSAPAPGQRGLNTLLPSPQLKDRQTDKLSLYQKDDKDSAEFRKQRHRRLSVFEQEMADTGLDVMADEDASLVTDGSVEAPFSATTPPRATRRPTRRSTKREPAAELEQKLAALQRHLAAADTLPTRESGASVPHSGTADAELAQLETLLGEFQQAKQQTEADPEMQQMDGMLDKILDIQHPSRVRDRLSATEQRRGKNTLQVAAVRRTPQIDGLLDQRTPRDSSAFPVRTQAPADGFFELNTSGEPPAGVANAVAAVIHETQTLVSGATVKLRIQQDIYLGTQLIPTGTFIYGSCSMNGERMQIAFTTLRYGQQIFPVQLTAYSLDGLPGIRIPGSMSRDASKKGTQDAIQSIGMTTLDPSLGTQAAAAGIDAAKTLLTKKVRLVRVVVKSDYPVLLVDGSALRR